MQSEIREPKRPALLATTCTPGSECKIEVLIERYETRQELFHNGDAEVEKELKSTQVTWFASLTAWEQLVYLDYYYGIRDEARAERFARRKLKSETDVDEAECCKDATTSGATATEDR